MSELEKYIESSKPKWYEWIPLVSLNYESRMNNYLKEMPFNNPIRNKIIKTFGKMNLYSLGITLIMTIVTPALAMIARSIVIKEMKK